ncbi:MAG: DUF1801 domain-containing protein [Candidatus Acidiferrum sp.]
MSRGKMQRCEWESTVTEREQLEKMMARFEPAIAGLAKKALAKMRKLTPGAVEMVYDNFNALVIGFAPGERPSEAVFSIVLYPNCVNLFFFQGKGLPDPGKRLRGSGNQVRSIRLESAVALDEPAIRELINVALYRAKVPFDPKQKRQLVIRAISKKRRPRRPGQSKTREKGVL